MRGLFISSTSLFWLGVLGFWAASLWLPETPDTRAVAADRTYSLAQVAKHASKDDCWMAIADQVYDFSAYVPQHPADPAVLLPWCGKEATEAYRTKTKGRPHSTYADQLLPKYRIGVLSESR